MIWGKQQQEFQMNKVQIDKSQDQKEQAELPLT